MIVYEFFDKKGAFIRNLLSVILLAAIAAIFIYKGWFPPIIGFVIAVVDFYYTKNSNSKNKIQIKELYITDDTIKFSFFYKSKDGIALKKETYNAIINEHQIIFNTKDGSTLLGIANKEYLEDTEKWGNLVNDVQL